MVAIVLGVATVVLFAVGVLHHAPGGAVEGAAAYRALQFTVTLVAIGAVCGCLTLVATMLAVGTRR